MAEERIAGEKQKISYDGIFNVKELYQVIDSLLKDKRYNINEKKVHESVSKTSKNIEKELEAEKKLSDYAKSVIKVKIKLSNVTEVKLKKDKKTKLMHQGKVLVITEGILKTDYGRKDWTTTRYFIRAIMEKWVYTSEVSKFEGIIKDDIKHLNDNLKAFLNLYK